MDETHCKAGATGECLDDNSLMGVLVGLLLALAIFWVVVYAILRLLKDVPLGTGNLWSMTDRENSKQAIASQQRLLAFWHHGWPFAVAALLAALIVAAVSG